MRVTYDRTKNIARILLTEYADEDMSRWKGLADHDIEGEFTFDFDKSGRLLGVEAKFASQGLPPDFLDDTDPV
jgi:uncharacterized protein YuzE